MMRSAAAFYKAAQGGEGGAVSRIASARWRIKNRLNKYLLSGGDSSVGGNLLLSSAMTAHEAAQRGEVARLAEARREIADARSKLAEEATK